MRINIDGGFVAAEKQESGKIAFSVGCEQFNPDGTRAQTLVNTASLTQEQLIQLFNEGSKAKGTHKFLIPTRELTNGLYFIKLNNGKYSKTLKLIISGN